MHDPEPRTAAGKVHFAFAMSLDGFVAGPGHTMEFLERTTLRDGLIQEYIEATGAVLAGRDGYDSAIGDSRPSGGRSLAASSLTRSPLACAVRSRSLLGRNSRMPPRSQSWCSGHSHRSAA